MSVLAISKAKKALYCFCAAAGFALSVLAPCFSVTGNLFYAPELVENPQLDTYFQGATKITDFTDVSEGAWYYPYIKLLCENKIIKGTSETTYSPDGTFSLAECAAVITRYLGLDQYATEQRTRLVSDSVEGGESWFSGYVATMLDTGVFDQSLLPDGMNSISDAESLSRPVKRYEFASFITRSFDIDTSKVEASCPYPEFSNNGGSYITGAKYDETVQSYEWQINDFSLIPEQHRQEVLKAYYNGIFNGDAVGNFNPQENLTRGEMSKVIAVIINRSMRQRNEYRSLTELYQPSDDKFIIDGWGDKTLDRAYGFEMLNQASRNMTISSDGKTATISYAHGAFPENYAIEVSVYSFGNGIYKLEKFVGIQGLPITYSGSKIRVLFTLRNLETAKVEGALRADISADGGVSYSNLFKPVL